MNIKPAIDLYEILEVKKTATQKEIKTSYRDLAKQYHPDKVNQDKSLTDVQRQELIDKMSNISIAYNILSDKKSRDLYDTTGKVDDKMSFDAEVDAYLNSVISKVLMDPTITVSNLIHKSEKVLNNEIDKLSETLEKIKQYRSNLSDILAKKCKPRKKDSKKKQKSKIKLSYIINSQIDAIDFEVEKLGHLKEVSDVALKNLDNFMDDHDERRMENYGPAFGNRMIFNPTA